VNAEPDAYRLDGEVRTPTKATSDSLSQQSRRLDDWDTAAYRVFD